MMDSHQGDISLPMLVKVAPASANSAAMTHIPGDLSAGRRKHDATTRNPIMGETDLEAEQASIPLCA
jgi:hypothetical protein